MRGCRIVKRPYRQIIDTHQAYATVHQPARPILGDGHKVTLKGWLATRQTVGVAGAKENALDPVRDIHLFQNRGRKVARFQNMDHEGGSNQYFEVELVHANAARHKMYGGVYVCSGVGPHLQAGEVGQIAAIQMSYLLDADRGVAQPNHERFGDR